jgi:hypothetical protein
MSRCSGQSFQVYRGQNCDILSSDVKMSSLWGKSRVLVLKDIAVANIWLGPVQGNGCSNVDILYWQGIFQDLFTLYQEISSPVPTMPERISAVQGNACNVISRIREMIGPALITPYMHVMEAHIADMIQATPFLSMGAFSCQSLELKNSHQSSVLFRQTMKGGGKGRTSQDKAQQILLDILNLELCLTFSCRDRESI